MIGIRRGKGLFDNPIMGKGGFLNSKLLRQAIQPPPTNVWRDMQLLKPRVNKCRTVNPKFYIDNHRLIQDEIQLRVVLPKHLQGKFTSNRVSMNGISKIPNPLK